MDLIKKGITLNSREIRNEFGYLIKYPNSFGKGTEVWIHYDKYGTILCIEPKIVEVCEE